MELILNNSFIHLIFASSSKNFSNLVKKSILEKWPLQLIFSNIKYFRQKSKNKSTYMRNQRGRRWRWPITCLTGALGCEETLPPMAGAALHPRPDDPGHVHPHLAFTGQLPQHQAVHLHMSGRAPPPRRGYAGRLSEAGQVGGGAASGTKPQEVHGEGKRDEVRDEGQRRWNEASGSIGDGDQAEIGSVWLWVWRWSPTFSGGKSLSVSCFYTGSSCVGGNWEVLLLNWTQQTLSHCTSYRISFKILPSWKPGPHERKGWNQVPLCSQSEPANVHQKHIPQFQTEEFCYRTGVAADLKVVC